MEEADFTPMQTARQQMVAPETELPGWRARKITLPTLATIAAVIAAVYFAKDVVLPLAIATLIAFALSPLVSRLRKSGMPNIPSVLMVVLVAFVAIAVFMLIVGSQLTSLAQNLPTFQANIIQKLDSLREAGGHNSIVGRIGQMITTINNEVGGGSTAAVTQPTGSTAPAAPAPMAVQMVDSQRPLTILRDVLLPLLSPIATVGLVIVVVIFMLLERDELRDRFIRLVGSNDLHRTTQVLSDAGDRVAQYLLVQLLVNVIYALPIGLGLFLIGVPNAVLWGLLTLVLRFVPYIGSFLAAAFPLFLSFAVSPDWSAVLWTIALFGVVELVTSNVIEPWLYGSRTGISPLGIIVSAVFWTWLWGPLGLVMSTPLTVCLVVLGRHMPQFELFDILLGDEPALAPHSRLYQRLLVGDVAEAAVLAEEALETQYLAEFYRDTGIPALQIAQHDHLRGVLKAEQQTRLATAVQQMVADLSDAAEEEVVEAQKADADPEGTLLDGAGYRVLCMGARSDLDDAAAAMLAQVLKTHGAAASFQTHHDLTLANFEALSAAALNCVIFSFLDTEPSRASFLHIRRIKRAMPALRVGVVIWEDLSEASEKGQDSGMLPPVTEATLQQAREIGADFAVRSLEAACKEAFTKAEAVPLTPRPKRAALSYGARPAA